MKNESALALEPAYLLHSLTLHLPKFSMHSLTLHLPKFSNRAFFAIGLYKV
jgi:hypothetical protein